MLISLDGAEKTKLDISQITEKKYTGKVYGPEVPVNHTLFVRRNGKTVKPSLPV